MTDIRNKVLYTVPTQKMPVVTPRDGLVNLKWATWTGAETWATTLSGDYTMSELAFGNLGRAITLVLTDASAAPVTIAYITSTITVGRSVVSGRDSVTIQFNADTAVPLDVASGYASLVGRELALISPALSTGVAPSITSITPDLGDTFGGARITITGTNFSGSISVNFGATPATSFEVVSTTTIRAVAPAKTAGTYTVFVSNESGTATLVNAYEAWHPTTDYAAARVYQADQEVTSSGSATRHRMGVQCQDMGVSALDPTDIAPLDGIGFVELANGRFLLAGGAPSGHANAVVNTIWYSDDRGKTWSVLLANAAGSATRPAPAHTFGFFTMTISGTEYVYWLGGDPFTPTGDVFRSADGGSTWSRISTSCPTSGLALFNYGILNDVIYVMGGQTSIDDTGVVSATVYKSIDYGVTWTTVGAAPWNGRGAQLGRLPELDGKLWIVAGARYHSTDVVSWYNDVWTWNGTDWTEVLADGHGQFAKRRYHSVVVYNNRLWMFNGSTCDGVTIDADTTSAYYSSDGITWTAWSDSFSWGDTHAQSAIATSTGIYLTEGFQSARLHTIKEHTGALVSGWADQGSDALDLSQSTTGKKPILDPAGFSTSYGSKSGLVFTRGQLLGLASPDRGNAGGVYEAYAVVRTLNFDETSAEGTNPPATIVGATNGSSWNNFGVTSSTLTITDATNASPIVVTVDAAHDLTTGDTVTVRGVLGNPAANDTWVVTVTSSTTFSLQGSTGNGAYTSGGTANVSQIRYRHYDGGWQTVSRGSDINDDEPHTLGVSQSVAGGIELYDDGTQQGSDGTGAHDATWTGFDAVGAGYNENDPLEGVVGAVVVLQLSAVSSATFKTKLEKWGRKWGSAA